MVIWRKRLLLACLFVGAAADLPGQSKQQDVERYLDRVGSFGFSGVVLLARHDSVFLHKAYGLASQNEGRPNTLSTAFDIASLAKPFTAAAVLKLAQDGRVQLSDSLGRFFANVPPDKAGITLHQLLSHTSGLSRSNAVTSDQPSVEVRVTRDSALARVWRTKLRFAPGSDWSYSNAGYVILAAVIETAGGEPFNTYLQHHVLGPAGLHETWFWGSSPGEAQPPIARPHDDAGEIDAPRSLPDENWAIRGAGGMYSTALDLYRWHRALRRGVILSEPWLSRLTTVVRNEYGYGWFVQRSASGRRVVQHGGDYSGVGAQLSWYPDDSVTLIVLANIRGESDEYPSRIVVDQAVPQILFGESYVAPPAVGRVAPDTELARLVGTYALPGGGSVMIGRSWNGLVVGAVGQDAADALVPGDSAGYRSALTSRTQELFNAIARGDPAEALARILAASDDAPYVRDQLVSEIAGLVPPGLRLDSAHALGTIPAAVPKGAYWTVSRLVFGSTVVPYRLRWYRDVVGSYHARSPDLAARVPLQPVEGGGWATWDLASRSGVLIRQEVIPGKPDAIIIASGANTTRAVRSDVRISPISRRVFADCSPSRGP